MNSAQAQRVFGPAKKDDGFIMRELKRGLFYREKPELENVEYDSGKMKNPLYFLTHQMYFDILIRIYTMGCGVAFIGCMMASFGLVDIGFGIWVQDDVEHVAKWYKFLTGGWSMIEGGLFIAGGITGSCKLMYYALASALFAIAVQILILVLSLVNRHLEDYELILLIVNVVISVLNVFLCSSYTNYLRHCKAKHEEEGKGSDALEL